MILPRYAIIKTKPQPMSRFISRSDRKQFIYRKYTERAYAHLDLLHSDQMTLNEVCIFESDDRE